MAVIMMMAVMIILPNHHHQVKNTCRSFKAESSRRALRCTVGEIQSGAHGKLYTTLLKIVYKYTCTSQM